MTASHPWIDRLADWPGLDPAPYPGTPEHERLVEEITFATGGVITAAECKAKTCELMIRRRLWPRGTTWTGDGNTEPKFPPRPHLRVVK